MEILKAESYVSVKELGERLFASQPTVRRDLNFLEKEGLVRRSHGGVILEENSINTPIFYRRDKRSKEKKQIARLASTLIENDQLIFVDGSSTALCLSDFMGESDGVTVVTNGIPMCQALAKQNIRVFSTGGRLVGESMAFVGSVSERTVLGFNADIMFFSSSSLSSEGAISDYAEEETGLRLTMHARSRRSVFLCDSEKFNRRSPFSLVELKDVDFVVTNDLLPEMLLKIQGLELIKSDNGAYMYGKKG